MESHITKGHVYKEGDDFDRFFKQCTTNGVQSGFILLWDEFKLNFRRKYVNTGEY